MGFVGNYAPCGLAPQIDDMPVIPKNVSPKGYTFFIMTDSHRPFVIGAFRPIASERVPSYRLDFLLCNSFSKPTSSLIQIAKRPAVPKPKSNQ